MIPRLSEQLALPLPSPPPPSSVIAGKKLGCELPSPVRAMCPKAPFSGS